MTPETKPVYEYGHLCDILDDETTFVRGPVNITRDLYLARRHDAQMKDSPMSHPNSRVVRRLVPEWEEFEDEDIES